MTSGLISLATALGLAASTLAAAPCVSSSFDLPMPGATNTKSFVSDVPSARFPAFWQEGNLDGYAYKIFGTAEATLRPPEPSENWEIIIACDVNAQSCEVEQMGVPPLNAVNQANRIGNCLLGLEVIEATPDPAPQTTKAEVPDVDVSGISEPIDAVVVAPLNNCNAPPIEDVNEVATLQRLLVMVGTDPGEIDGIMGPKTTAALSTLTTTESPNLTLREAISLLEERACGPQSE